MREPLFRPEPVSFFVPGVPQPGGSKKAFVVRMKTGVTRAVVTEDAKHNAPWRAVVSLAARQAMEGRALFTGALSVSFDFVMPRPKGHYRTGAKAHLLRDDAPLGHTCKPDRTKLMRSTEDALTGIVWKDDCQVCAGPVTKLYTRPRPEFGGVTWQDTPGCHITISHFF